MGDGCAMPYWSDELSAGGAPPFQEDDMAEMWGESAVRTTADAERGAWFAADRFGLFIHWGLYSQAAGEWGGKRWFGISEWLMRRARIPVDQYAGLAGQFNPVEFDADEWVRLAREAGMRYIIITTKHHDGFAMFSSSASAFNICEATPFARDPIAELADACHRGGIRLGFYYSQFQDWHEPDGAGNDWNFPERGDFGRYLREKALPQIEELLTRYGPVAMIWFDTPGTISAEDSQALYQRVRDLQPGCLVNSRIGNGYGDYATLGDQEVPLVAPDGLWESIDTHNDTWGFATADHDWKSTKEVVGRLIRIASMGGNYVLNVGPDGRGAIPQASAKMLRRAGEWLKRNGTSIFGTVRGAIPLHAWGCSTSRPGIHYLHILNWPEDDTLWVAGVGDQVKSVRELTTGAVLPHHLDQGKLIIALPRELRDPIATVIEIAAERVAAATVQSWLLHPGISNCLEAPFAVLEGCRLGKVQWMERFGDWHHTDVVDGWQAGATAAWDIQVVRPGSYLVGAEYECLPEADETEFELSVGTVCLPFPVLCTGGRFCGRVRFRRERVGVVQLDECGQTSIGIRCMSEKAMACFRLCRLIVSEVDW